MGNSSNTGPTALLGARINAAFAARRYPGDAAIAYQRPECVGYEGNTAANFLGGRDWRTLTFAQLMADYDAPPTAIMSFLRPPGLAYYLPGFLLMALPLLERDGRAAPEMLFAFADSLCFALTRPSPDSLREQYELVKEMPEVPDDIKESLRNPTPEARRAERARVVRHAELVALLTAPERAAVAAALAALAGCLGDAPNQAHAALRTTWGQYAGLE